MESVKPQSFDGQENLDALRSDEVVELEIPESESPEDRLLRRSEVLDEQSQEKLARLVSDADKIAKTKDIFSGKQYVSDEALQDFETFLLPEESGSDKPDALKTAIHSPYDTPTAPNMQAQIVLFTFYPRSLNNLFTKTPIFSI